MKKASLTCCIITLALISLGIAPALMDRVLVANYPLHTADAMVLLAGAYKERAPVAARLFREGYAPRIILTNDGVFSRWSSTCQRNLYNVEWAEELLVSQGVPRQAILKLPFRGSGTIYDALTARNSVLRHGFRSLIIVTDDYHSRRAFWTFSLVFRGYPVTMGTFPIGGVCDSAPQRITMVKIQEFVKLAYYLMRFNICKNFGHPLAGFMI